MLPGGKESPRLLPGDAAKDHTSADVNVQA
jgi:hypothetical protein